jgi:3-oxoacyl-[acyl-carrier protein] reductase
MNQIDLAGRVAVITGGASGIGRATAERFLRSGATVEIWGRSPAKLDEAVHGLAPVGPLHAAQVDVSRFDQVLEATQAAEDRHGKIDILFNCAGILTDALPVQEFPLDAWHETIAVNLTGTFYACKAVLPGMLKRGYGRIVNTASMAGKEGNPFQVAYSASKGGVIALTKSISKEFAGRGVTVNCVAPTIFSTPMVATAVRDAPQNVAQVLQMIPMGRMGEPDEAAAMIAWLASAECSFTTGFTFDLSGGRATY